MLGSIPHQKFCFYHFPTRGRLGGKHGGADMSPTYLYFFIVPCCYIIKLGCFIIILYHFFIVPSACCYFSMFFTTQKINIKWSPNVTKLYGEFLWSRRNIMGPSCTWGMLRGEHNPQGASGGPGAPWWVVPTTGAPRTTYLLYKYPNIPETLKASTKYSSSRRRVQNHQKTVRTAPKYAKFRIIF